MDTSEVLNKAADRIESAGWWQDVDGGHHDLGGVCAGDSIALCAMPDRKTVMAGSEAFWTYLGGDGIRSIWDWNDAPERTATEVVEALRAAAVIAAARESATQPAPVAAMVPSRVGAGS